MCTINTNNTWCVYAHINKTNGKQYIGITSQEPQKRWGNNGCHYKGSEQRCFYNAIQKYGWDGFEHKILFTDLSEQDAKAKEKELIQKYHTCIYDKPKNGYNMTFGGEGAVGYKHSMKARRKMSEDRKGEKNAFFGHKHTKENKDKMSKQRKNTGVGKDNHFYGCHHSEETKQLLSKLASKKVGALNPNYGNHKLAGKNHPMYGKHLKQETKEKISKSRKGVVTHSIRVLCHENGKIYDSITAAAKDLNLDNGTIGKCVKGKCKSVKGYHFSYAPKEV